MTTTRVQPRGDLALMTGYHSPQLDVPVRLNTNESPVGPPTAWVDELAAALADVAWNRYPDREAVALRSALADHHATTLDRVFCANGSNEVLQSVLLAYGGAGRSAATFEPTYAVHSHLARVTGTGVIAGERGDDFALERDEVDRVLAQGPGVVFLCSPDNPTGLVADPDLVASLADRCAGAGALLVVDEAYGQFASSTALDLVDDDRPLLVTRTFSKTWAMAAGRLGYADDMDERVRLIVSERERLVAGLGRLPLQQWPSGANFVLFRPEGASGDAVWQALVERGVLVRNCASWPRLTDCLRVTVGTPDENDRFLTALEKIL